MVTKKRRTFGIGEIICSILLALFAIIIIYPLFWVLMSSLKDYNGIFNNVWGIPENFMWQNYADAWNKGISGYLINSLIVTSTTIIGVVLLASMCAFGLVHLKGRLGTVLFAMSVGGMLLSPQVCLMPLYILLRNLGLHDTLGAMIVPYIAFRLPMSILLIRSFFIEIPKELEESAIIDGCSMPRVYASIYMPLSKPIISTSVIVTAYYAWNELLFATMFVDSTEFKTIPIGLMAFRGALETNWGVVLAGMVIACTPVIILFLAMQKNFIRGMTSGAVKG